MSQTYKPKKRKRARTHGFRVTNKTGGRKRKSGPSILNRRRAKGRKRLTT